MPKTTSQKLKALLNEYSRHSTIHGISYISEKDRPWCEKAWWITVFCISILFCGKLISNAWHINPIIISFKEKPTPVWQIPFPAITICPMTHARSDRINITDMIRRQMLGESVFQNLSEKEQLQTLAKNTLCPIGVFVNEVSNYTHCNGCLRVLQEIRVPFDSMFSNCKFRNRNVNCSEYLTEIFVNYKYCASFNDPGVYRKPQKDGKADIDNWNIDKGYKQSASIDVYPYRALGAGAQFGFSIIMRNEKRQFDYACVEKELFALEYRMPNESPQFMTNFFHIPMSNSFNLIVEPQMMTTSDDLRPYAPTKRKCFFSNEHRLQYFKLYTQSNCEIECQVELVLQNCGCFPFFIEPPEGFDICGPARHACISKAKEILYSQHFEQCKCLPTCSSIIFDSEVSSQRLNASFFEQYVDNYDERFHYAKINVYFKENHFLSRERKEIYGSKDFVANCGALMGLFLGVSVLSCLELVNFCTVRLWVHWYIDGDDESEREPKSDALVSSLDCTARSIRLLKSHVGDYFKKSTLHEIKYIAQQSLMPIERAWWVLVIVGSLICCGSLIADALKRFDQSPVMISYAHEETPISRIPYPAITICPQLIFQGLPLMFNYFKVQNLSLYALDEQSKNVAIAAAQVCGTGAFDKIDPQNETHCETCADTLKFLMGTAEQAFRYCSHFNLASSCQQIFDQIVTDDGVCFVYNSIEIYRSPNVTNDRMILDDWNLEDGYRHQTGKVYVYPRPGSKMWFTFYMNINQRMIDGICKDAVQGFKVFFHLPNEAPQISKHFYVLSFSHYTQILLKPKVTVTAPELRELPADKRQCYFSDERYLKFFRHYTQNNCEIECIVNLTLKTCGCLMYYMPRIPGVRFCGLTQRECYQAVVRQNLEENIRKSQSSSCQCLITCTSISYATEVSHIPFSEKGSVTKIDLVFRDNQFIALQRDQLFGKTELLANCGGLLGLFLGFSFISILELIYFCTIRLFCDFRTEFSRNKSS